MENIFICKVDNVDCKAYRNIDVPVLVLKKDIRDLNLARERNTVCLARELNLLIK
jgi:hypothetical protein